MRQAYLGVIMLWNRIYYIAGFVVLIGFLSLTGCGTCITLTNFYDANKFQEAGIYSGVCFDVKFCFVGEGAHMPMLIPVAFLDIPLSFAVDTALLPVTIPIELLCHSEKGDQ